MADKNEILQALGRVSQEIRRLSIDLEYADAERSRIVKAAVESGASAEEIGSAHRLANHD
ncbi:hypothetical protein [Amycolatopsis anabasis]|uniref:hypothetical protein n=1 Tax=Amycolatopsis anabasis TaxID=1840409 RepID=UPI00131C70F5|nr:hypothetical protein [Amycolatopsis anabasis]